MTAPMHDERSTPHTPGHDGPVGDAAQAARRSADELVALYRGALLVQQVDRRLTALSRAGRIGFHGSLAGEEAMVAGAALGVGPGDWVFAGSRGLAAALARGVEVERFVARAFGGEGDPCKGRSMPDQGSFRAVNVVSTGSPLGAHLTHAVGAAWAARLRGDARVALALGGASSCDAGDFHNSLNFAGVFGVPVVFVLRGHAGSTGAVAAKGVAYGVPGVTCDGRDALAVHEAVRVAAERGRAGRGPTLIECAFDEHGGEGGHDPLVRLRERLERDGVLAAGVHDEASRVIGVALEAAVDRASRQGQPAIATLFDDVFAALPWHLVDQRDEAARAARGARRGV